MACTLSNKCAKNLSKQTVLLQLIIKRCFLEHSVHSLDFVVMRFLMKLYIYIFIHHNIQNSKQGHHR